MELTNRIGSIKLSESIHNKLKKKVKKETPRLKNLIRIKVNNDDRYEIYFKKNTSQKTIDETIRRIKNRDNYGFSRKSEL